MTPAAPPNSEPAESCNPGAVCMSGGAGMATAITALFITALLAVALWRYLPIPRDKAGQEVRRNSPASYAHAEGTGAR